MWTDFTFFDFIGILGSLIISAAYLAVSVKWADPEGIPFQSANGIGSIMLLFSLYFRQGSGVRKPTAQPDARRERQGHLLPWRQLRQQLQRQRHGCLEQQLTPVSRR